MGMNDGPLVALLRQAARYFDAAWSAALLFDGERVWSRAAHGIMLSDAALRELRVLAHHRDGLLVEDAAAASGFGALAAATGCRFVAARSFAFGPHGFVGIVVVADARPRRTTAAASDHAMLATLATTVQEEMAAPDLARERPGDDRFLRLLMRHVPAFLWTTDEQLRFTSGFGAYLDHLQLPASQLAGVRLTDYFGSGPARDLIEAKHRIALAGETAVYDGTWFGRVFHTRLEPLRDDQGAIVGTVGVAVDVTEQRALEAERTRVEEALVTAKRRLKHLMTAGPAVIYSSRLLDGFQVTFMSEGVRDLTGFEAQRFIDEPGFWVERIHPDDRVVLTDHLFQTLIVGRHTYEYRFLCADGTHRWIRDELRLVRDTVTGVHTEVVGHWADITELKQSIEAARQSEERYRLTAQATNDVVWDWVPATGELSWSASCASSFGYAPEEVDSVIGWWEERIAPEDRERVLCSLHDALAADQTTWTMEYRFRRGDGTFSEISDRGFILRDAAGQPVRMVGAMTDVTERNRLRTQMMQSDRLASIGTLAAGVAHEINNPLACVLANIDFVREQLAPRGGSEPLLEAIADAAEGAGRVRQIVRDLKIFARGGESCTGPVDLRKALESAISLASNEIRHCAQLTRRFDPTPMIKADESRLAQVFLNLLVNAAQAIGEGHADAHTIEVVTGTDARGWATATVRDDGPGMAPDVLARIYDPFFTTKPVGVGTGLGLSICHGIVDLFGGEITVASEPGSGTTFQVAFPPHAGALPAGPHRSPAPSVRSARGRILVIDDEPAVGRTVQRTLEGHEVVVVHSGREGLQRIGAGAHFDVVLCDLMMPELSGMDVYAALVRSHPDVAARMLFMTGGVFSDRARQFLSSLVNPVIGKPFESAGLRSAVERVLSRGG